MLYADHYRLFLQDILDKPNASSHMWALIEGAQKTRPMSRFITDGGVVRDMWHLLPKEQFYTATARPWSALALGIRE